MSVRTAAGAMLLALLLLACSARGPDFAGYLEWAEGAFSGNLAHADTATLSPLNVPVLMWSHGAGFVFAAGHLLLGVLGGLESTSLLVGWLFSMLFWAAMMRVFWLASSANLSLTLFGGAALFVGTHAGYHSHVHATESLALACVAVLVWRAFENGEPAPVEGLIIGLATAFLLTIRPYLALYAVPTVAVVASRSGRRLSVFGVAGIPVAVAIAQNALVNRWMTGSLLQPSYVFGDAAFQSLDLGSPEMGAVLFHPFHGLLVYHPMYALAFAALVMVVVVGRWRERALFFGLGGVVVLLHLYLQAAWVAWWMGTGTFGSRGMAPACALLMPALVIVLRDCYAAAGERGYGDRRVATMFAVATLAASSWSALLLAQGPTHFYAYRPLLNAQLDRLALSATPAPLATIAVAALLAGVLFPGTWQQGDALQRTLGAAACALIGLSGAYLAMFAAEKPILAAQMIGRGVFGLTLVGAAAFVVIAAARRLVTAARFEIGWMVGPVLIASVVFLVMSGLFFRFAVSIEQQIAGGRSPQREYEFVNTFSVLDMKYTCGEYNEVEGFDEQRDALRQFLLRQPGMTERRLRC